MQKLRCLVLVAGLSAPVFGAQTAPDPWPPPGVLTLPSPGVVPPALVERVNPTYTRDAMFAKVQGVVGLSCVIEPDGSVGAVKVIRPLGSGLDEQAIAAAKQWRFKPATKDGVAVRVVVPINLGFSLKGEPPPSTWPSLFPGGMDPPASDPDWTEAKTSSAGVSVVVPHPKSWELVQGNVTGRLMAIRSPTSVHFVDISSPGPLPVPLPLPMPVMQLDQATLSLAKVIGAHDFSPVGGGQARAFDRWWLWQDHVMPTSAASRLPPELRGALSAEFDSMRLWTFVTSVENNAVIVFFWALVPRGLSPADIDKDLRSATAVFDRMIKRMSLQKTAVSSHEAAKVREGAK